MTAPAIRPFVAGDVAEIRAVVTAVLAEFGFTPDHRGTDVDLSDLEAHYRARGGEFWVVEHDGRVIGTCGLWVDPGDPSVCELRKMYLLPAARGHGLGRRLLDRALDHGRRAGCTRMVLETASAMEAAIGLYRSAGFRETADESPCASRCDRTFALDL